MPSTEITKYFESTENRKIREDLVFAVENVIEPKIAIDCGCGAGADINYLVSKGFNVYGFDVEEESISRCEARYKNIENVILSKSSFSTYNYPKASLVVADASLFFCPVSEFSDVWKKITRCLVLSGIFCGSFLGTEDTMANPDYDRRAFWQDVAVFDEKGVRKLFVNYEILRFNVHKTSGITTQGATHYWHVFSVVARKSNKRLQSDPVSPWS